MFNDTADRDAKGIAEITDLDYVVRSARGHEKRKNDVKGSHVELRKSICTDQMEGLDTQKIRKHHTVLAPREKRLVDIR